MIWRHVRSLLPEGQYVWRPILIVAVSHQRADADASGPDASARGAAPVVGAIAAPASRSTSREAMRERMGAIYSRSRGVAAPAPRVVGPARLPRMKRVCATILVPLVLLLTLGLSADGARAARTPTAEEMQAIAAGIGAPAGLCALGQVSDDGRWAAVVAVNASVCGAAPHLRIVARDDAGAWRLAAQTEYQEPVCAVDLAGVPEAVAVELTACVRDPVPAAIHRDVLPDLTRGCVTEVRRSRGNPAYAGFVVPPDEACETENGRFLVVREEVGRWKLVADASQGVLCNAPGVRAVPRDILRTCRRPLPRRMHLPCVDTPAWKVVQLRVRPASCIPTGLDTSISGTLSLVQLRWSSWGARTARARARVLPNHRYGDERPRPVTVTVSGRSTSCGPESPFYTRIKVTARRWSQLVRAHGQPPRRVRYPAMTIVRRVGEPTVCPARD